MDDFNVDFVLKFNNYTSLKRFLYLKWILKNFSTILHSQFNYHTLPVPPFNDLIVNCVDQNSDWTIPVYNYASCTKLSKLVLGSGMYNAEPESFQINGRI